MGKALVYLRLEPSPILRSSLYDGLNNSQSTFTSFLVEGDDAADLFLNETRRGGYEVQFN
jgi:hypothetical protein